MDVATVSLSEAEEAEITGVLRWRFRQLCRGGLAPEDAARVAARFDVDLHEVLQLLSRGCPSETAVRILL